MDISALKSIPIADFLRRLGYAPVEHKGRELTYFAPYRKEHKPSFRVNVEKNVFYDFGTGCGGDIFKLAGEFIHSTDFKAQAKYIADSMNMQLPMKEHPSLLASPLNLFLRMWKFHGLDLQLFCDTSPNVVFQKR